MLRALSEQLSEMRNHGAEDAQLDPLEAELVGLGRRVAAMERALSQLQASQAPPAETGGGAGGIEAMLRRDRRQASRFASRVADVRGRMVGAANAAALRALRELRINLGGYLRRSRIGRIDAVMGSKRRIEIQIESLAAGRFPPELQDPLSIQGLLRDDEEYWPFEGEYWADEFEEDPALEEELDEEDDLDVDEEAELDEEEEGLDGEEDGEGS